MWEWCGKEQEVKKISGERSTIGGEETESTYSPVYLLYPVGDSFFKRSGNGENKQRVILGISDGILVGYCS